MYDIDGELRLLEAEGLVRVYEPEPGYEGGYVGTYIRGLELNRRVVSEYFQMDFMEYMERKNLSFQKIIGNLDFGQF